MICIRAKCAREIPDDAIFCPYCGRKQIVEKRRRKRPNGAGTVVKLDNGKYKAVKTLGYYHMDGKLRRRTVTKTFSTSKEAQDALPQLGQGLESVPHDNFTVSELHDFYLATHQYDNSSDSNKDKMRYAWNRSVHLSDRLITDVMVDDIQSIIDDNNLTFYPAKDVRTLWSHMFRQAIRRGVNVPNKSEYVELPVLKKSPKLPFSDFELALLWAGYEDGDKIAGYILVMCYTSMRYGELASIRLSNIHLDERYMVGGIKSEAGRNRTIPIAAKIMPIIEDLCKGRKHKLLEMSEDNFYKRYYETLERLGIRRLSPHACRHTFFTRITAAGIQPGVIIATGGHTDYETTQTYIHLPVSELIAAVDKL